MADLGCTGDAERFLDETGDGPVVLAQHAAYTAGGTPVFVQLDHLACTNTAPTFPHLEIVGYGSLTQLPLGAEGWECCNAFCTDAEEDADACYVQEDCWPFGPGPGITRKVRIHLSYRHPCSFNGVLHSVTLVYNDTDEKWYGIIPITNGDLCLAFSCDPLLDFDDPGKFILEFQRTECPDTDIGTVAAGFDCADPLRVNFPPFGLPLCCIPSDPTCSPPEDAPNVVVTVMANCRKTLFATHVAYTPAGLPIVAKPKECSWHGQVAVGCCDGSLPGDLLLTIEYAEPGQCCYDTDDSQSVTACEPTLGYWLSEGFCTFHLKCNPNSSPDGSGTGWQLKMICDVNESAWMDPDTASCDPFDLFFDMTNAAIAVSCCSVDGILHVRITEP